MKTFELSATVNISISTKVEAETLEEAIEIAKNREIEASDFNGENENEAWISSEYDGMPQNIECINV